MADDVAITAGSGTNVAADERTINSVSVKIQRMVMLANDTQAVGATTSITTTETQIVAARETRRFVVITNVSSFDIYIGPTGLTTANGTLLPPGAGMSWDSNDAVYGRCAVATTGEVRYIDYYD